MSSYSKYSKHICIVIQSSLKTNMQLLCIRNSNFSPFQNFFCILSDLQYHSKEKHIIVFNWFLIQIINIYNKNLSTFKCQWTGRKYLKLKYEYKNVNDNDILNVQHTHLKFIICWTFLNMYIIFWIEIQTNFL